MSVCKIAKSVLAGTLLVALATQAMAGSFSQSFWTWIFSPIQISKLDDLQFGTIAPDLTSAGIVTVNSGSDNSSVCGTPLSCFENGDRALFRVTGRLLQLVNLDVSNAITLDNGNSVTMLVDNFDLDSSYSGGWFALLIGAGAIDIGVGADLHVAANQAAGTYTGTFVVTASYQ